MRRIAGLAAAAVLAALLLWLLGTEPARPGPAAVGADAKAAPRSASIAALEADDQAPAPAERLGVDVGAADFRASPGTGTLVVTVRALPGLEPLPYVAVTTVAADGRDEPSTSRTLVTDVEGRVRFDALDAGPWRTHHDRGPPSGWQGAPDTPILKIEPGRTTEHTFGVPPGIDAQVRTVDASGARVPAAVIHYWPAGATLDVPTMLPPLVLGRTDANGELRVPALWHLGRHGAWFGAEHEQLGASKLRMVPSPLDDHDDEVRVLELVLGERAGGSIGLLVAGAARAPLAGALASARPIRVRSSEVVGDLRSLDPAVAPATTDGLGRASLAPLAPADYLLRVRARGYAPYHERVRIDGTAPLSRDVELAPAAVARGTVCDPSGRAVAGVAVDVQIDPTGGSAWTAADGTFEIGELSAGQAAWTTRHEAHASAAGAVTLEPGEVTELRIVLEPLPRLSGRLLDGHDVPLAGWEVTAIADLPGNAADRRRMQTAADGAFTTFARRDVEYALRIVEPGQRLPIPLADPPLVRARDEPWVVRVPDAARATAFVAGFLVDAEGRPAIAGRALSLQGATAARVWFGVDGPGIDPATGSFRVGPVSPGRYTLWFAGEEQFEFPVRDVVLTPGATTQLGRITLPATGTIAVAIELAAGFEPGDVLVQIEHGEDYDLLKVDRETWTASMPAMPGEHLVTVYGDGFRSRRERVEVVLGATVTVRATLERGVVVGLRLHMPAGEREARFEVRDARGEVAFDVEMEPGNAYEDWWPTLERGTFGVFATGGSGRRYWAELTVESLEPREAPVDVRVEPVR